MKKSMMLGMTCVIVLFIASACSACKMLTTPFGKKDSVLVVSYNAQTFFDAIDDGCEFGDFDASSSEWTVQKYTERLERLHEALLLAGKRLSGESRRSPDIVVLQEIENKTVIEDFCKRLPRAHAYSYALCPPTEAGVPFSLALLSRFPITETRMHHVYAEDVSLRPIIEAHINIGSERDPFEIAFFSVHWKSKRGKSATNSIRQQQEQALYRRLKELESECPTMPFVICGDFNQRQEEFRLLSEYNNVWDLQKGMAHSSQNPEGSYYFKKQWEAIDHIFYSNHFAEDSALSLSDFQVVAETPLISSQGIPQSYRVYNGKGYSDHLPIGIEIMRNPEGF